MPRLEKDRYFPPMKTRQSRLPRERKNLRAYAEEPRRYFEFGRSLGGKRRFGHDCPTRFARQLGSLLSEPCVKRRSA